MNIQGGAEIRVVTCNIHSLMLSKSGKLYGYGWNNNVKLFIQTEKLNVIKIDTKDLNGKIGRAHV